MSDTLRQKVIKLSHQNEKLRPYLLEILKQADEEEKESTEEGKEGDEKESRALMQQTLNRIRNRKKKK